MQILDFKIQACSLPWRARDKCHRGTRGRARCLLEIGRAVQSTTERSGTSDADLGSRLDLDILPQSMLAIAFPRQRIQ